MKSNKHIIALLATLVTFSVIAADYQEMEEITSDNNGMNEQEEETETERIEDTE